MSKVEEIKLEIVQDAITVYGAKDNPVEGILSSVKEKVMSVVADVDDAKGRETIRSMAYAVARTKSGYDKLAKEYTADLRKQLTAVNDRRKELIDGLQEIQDEYRKPLTEWEAEQARIKQEQQERIEEVKRLSSWTNSDGELAETDIILDRLQFLDDLRETAQTKEEKDAIASGIRTLEEKVDVAKKRDQERAEIERIRKENEELQRKQAEEQAKAQTELEELRRQNAELKAKQEKEEREKLEAELEKMRAEKAKQDEELRKAQEAQKVESEPEQKPTQGLSEAIEMVMSPAIAFEVSNRQLKTQQIVDDLRKASSIDHDQASEICNAIVEGLIRHVTFIEEE